MYGGLHVQGFIQKEYFGGEVDVAVSCTVTPPPIKHCYGLMIVFSDVTEVLHSFI